MEYEVKIALNGFENIEKFKLENIDDTFSILKFVDNDNIQLSLVNPYKLTLYSFDVPNAIKALLELKETSNIKVFLVLLLKNPKEDSTVNFLAPIIFNNDNGKMAQVVLDSEEYPHYAMDAILKNFTLDEDD
jgi:flagellar assembly factor FliW